MTKYPKPSWRIRRNVIYCALIFCSFCVLWVMISENKSSVAEMIVLSSFGLAGSLIASYIFGAVMDDRNYMSALKPKQDDISSDNWEVSCSVEEDYDKMGY